MLREAATDRFAAAAAAAAVSAFFHPRPIVLKILGNADGPRFDTSVNLSSIGA